jgi:predicted TIM-barrel fold metal-dependent hydrolase
MIARSGSVRADAHIHLFEGGYHASLAGRPGVQLDEAVCYASLAAEHQIQGALVVGYAAAAWCAQNNTWLAQQVARHAWVRPLAYVDPARPPDLAQLERWAAAGFVGLSLYLFDRDALAALQSVPDAVWAWLAAHGWLISVNSSGEHWLAWQGILRRHPTLRLLASHLGLPPRVAQPPSEPEAERALASVLALSAYPGPRVKLCGFYALSDPGYDYPHCAVWPYVVKLLAHFGAQRLLWASDFSPCLDTVTLPQTLGLLAHMPFLSAPDREAIEGSNLLALLDTVSA